jgi:hypothetical protein
MLRTNNHPLGMTTLPFGHLRIGRWLAKSRSVPPGQFCRSAGGVLS